MVTSYIPEAGDIVVRDFGPQVGREQAKWRLALLLNDIQTKQPDHSVPSMILLKEP